MIFFYSLYVQIKGSQNILNIKLQSSLEGGAPVESCYLALLRVGKLSLKQVQLGQSKLDRPLGTDDRNVIFFSLHIQIKGNCRVSTGEVAICL